MHGDTGFIACTHPHVFSSLFATPRRKTEGSLPLGQLVPKVWPYTHTIQEVSYAPGESSRLFHKLFLATAWNKSLLSFTPRSVTPSFQGIPYSCPPPSCLFAKLESVYSALPYLLATGVSSKERRRKGCECMCSRFSTRSCQSNLSMTVISEQCEGRYLIISPR